jgi:hypothetical protein
VAGCDDGTACNVIGRRKIWYGGRFRPYNRRVLERQKSSRRYSQFANSSHIFLKCSLTIVIIRLRAVPDVPRLSVEPRFGARTSGSDHPWDGFNSLRFGVRAGQ